MNTYDWLATKDIKDYDDFDIVEVSFSPSAGRHGLRSGPAGG
jgi:hypothetical protein